ncbi:winged helix-turn-helix transcriptional regulator [Patescibacteria group bacterium]|nr:winged helix-turn-helix transcriptional regulator [Patescibacteria group bacterium]
MLTGKEVQKIQKSIKREKERLPFVFDALADPTRLKIFRLFITHKDLCVTDLSKVCKISVPAVSYQLKIMEIVGLIEKERMGKMICYKLRKEDSLVKKIISILK